MRLSQPRLTRLTTLSNNVNTFLESFFRFEWLKRYKPVGKRALESEECSEFFLDGFIPNFPNSEFQFEWTSPESVVD